MKSKDLLRLRSPQSQRLRLTSLRGAIKKTTGAFNVPTSSRGPHLARHSANFFAQFRSAENLADEPTSRLLAYR